MLTGPEIIAAVHRGDIECDPFEPKHVGANSLDLRLGEELLTYDTTYILDMKRECKTRQHLIGTEGIVLYPGVIYLGHTVESLGSRLYVPCVEGRSSVGRLGISVHLTAGIGDCGFHGTFTLELSVVEPVRVYAGVRICQALFFPVTGRIGKGYEGKYQQQTGPRPSMMYRDFEEG